MPRKRKGEETPEPEGPGLGPYRHESQRAPAQDPRLGGRRGYGDYGQSDYGGGGGGHESRGRYGDERSRGHDSRSGYDDERSGGHDSRGRYGDERGGGFESRGGYGGGSFESRGRYGDERSRGHDSRSGYGDERSAGYESRGRFGDERSGGFESRGGYGGGSFESRGRYGDERSGGYESRGRYGDERSGGFESRGGYGGGSFESRGRYGDERSGGYESRGGYGGGSFESRGGYGDERSGGYEGQGGYGGGSFESRGRYGDERSGGFESRGRYGDERSGGYESRSQYGGDRSGGYEGGGGRGGGGGGRGGQYRAPMSGGRGGGGFSSQAGPSAPPPDIPGAPAPQRAPAAISSPEEQMARPVELAYTPDRAVRPDFGREGRSIKVKANWFKVDCSLTEAYHYDVEIKGARRPDAPEQPPEPRGPAAQRPLPAEICRAAMTQVASDRQWPAGYWAFDGRKNMYAPFTQLVPGDELTHEVAVTLEGEGRPRNLSVLIRRVAIIPIASLHAFMKGQDSELAYHAIQALDIVLKHRASYNRDCLPIGRAFFYRDQNVRSIGGGAEVWLGYQQSLRPCQTGLALNIDMAATAMLEAGELTNLMYQKIGSVQGQGLSPVQVRTLSRALKGIKVKTKHNSFKKAIRSVCRGSPFEERFMNEAAGKEMTVAEYFQQQYNIRLTNRDLPCIAVGNGKVILPPELCTIVEGQRRSKLTETQTAEMIKTAAQRPDDKSRWIDSVVSQKATFGKDPNMKGFQMQVDGRQMEVAARVLPSPRLAYGSPANYDPKGFGAWNLRDVRFLTGSTLASWGVACFANPRFAEADLTRLQAERGSSFIKDFIDMLNACGVKTPTNPLPPCIMAPRGAAPAETLRRAADAARQVFNAPPQLILVVLPDTGQQLYREVKQASDSMLGVPSQCVVAKKAGIGFPARGRPQYCANVAMKVNAKLDGCNVRLLDPIAQVAPPIGPRPFMVFGADVTHPVSGEGMPSIAALVGSMDASATRYAARVSMQSGRQEIIADLKNMMKDLLLEFHRVTRGRKPEHLIFFRDGISEGQFREVYYSEYSAVREACKEMGDPGSEYAPPITFVVIHKRHHTRLFPLPQDHQNRDRSGNVLPGTVVDTGICHPFEFDFYLSSHAGIQGTSRATKYHVLVDENKFTADGLQGLIYKMCYLFCRCTRSISVVPAAKYAHLAAFRGRVLCRGGDSETGSVSSGGSGTVEFLPVHSQLNKTMFYV